MPPCSEQLTWTDRKDTTQVHGLITLLQEERKHLRALGVDLVRLGLEQRQLEISEQQHRALGEALVHALSARGYGEDIPTILADMRSRLTA